jgi:6-phosphogluconolactonase (cycloisomerase 2 family)
MRNIRTLIGTALISASALAGTVAISVSGVTATSYIDPVQQASWNYQDSSLPNPNNVGVWGADITPDGNYIVLGENKQARVRIIDINTGSRIRTVTVGAEPNEIDIDSTGTYAWVMNAWDNSISRVTIASGAVSTPITSVCSQGARGMRNMVLTPNDQYLVVSCASQWSDSGTSVQIIKLSDNSVTSVTNGSNPLIRLVMSPTGNFVYASTIWGQVTSAGTPVTRIAIPSGNIDNTFSVQTTAGSTTADGPAFLGINSTGSTLYVASNNGVFSAWNNLGGNPNKLWSSYLGHGGLGNVLGPTPFVVDHTRGLGYLIYQNQGGLWPEVLDVYDLSTGTRATRVAINHQWSASITLSDDGQTLISSGWRFSDMYKYRVGQAVTTTTSSTTTTTTTTTSTTTTTTTTTVPTSSTTVGSSTTVAPGSSTPTTVAAGGGGTNSATSPTTVAATTTTTTTTTTTLPPAAEKSESPAPAPDAPTAAPGSARLTVNGSTADLSIQRANNALKVAGSGVEISVSAIDDSGAKIALDSDGNLRVTSDDRLVVDASGFGANEELEAWLFSTPSNLGTVTTNEKGVAAGTFDVPNELEDGEHRLVLKSATESGEETVIAIGLIAGAENTGTSGTSVAVGVVIALAVLAGLFIPVVIRRRKEEQA